MVRQLDCGIAALEDAHWSRDFQRQPYCRVDREYEDYAPAYCVGYCGFSQYGGSFADAERCLIANWLRIKGDSRLDWEEARQAIGAAWSRTERAAGDMPEVGAVPAGPTAWTPDCGSTVWGLATA